MAVQATPAEVGIALANWNWKVVRQFIEARCGIRLCRSACPRDLHRLGFAYKRPKKRPLKADEARRAAFVEEYAALGQVRNPLYFPPTRLASMSAWCHALTR